MVTGSLFPTRVDRVERVQHMSPQGKVPFPNASSAEYALDGRGRRWVRKQDVAANELLAEAAGWMLSGLLDVPTPLGAVSLDGGIAAWLSEVVDSPIHWAPARAEMLVEPGDLGAILALDALIGNWDRHDGNLLLSPRDTPEQLAIFSIDVAAAWIGTAADIVAHGLEPPPVDRLARGIPVDMVRHGAEDGALRACGITDATLREIVAEAADIAGVRSHKEIGDALVVRCADAPAIVHKYLAMIEARR